MFHKARIKLTLYYLAVIMIVSLFFSGIIYRSLTFELNRIENLQRIRRPNPVFIIDPEIVRETKSRIFFSLVSINVAIFGISGVLGYFLAGKTLDPISKMVEEQKEFIGNASHELRTPLSSLKTQIEVSLRDKSLKISDAKEILKSALEDVNKMTKLANYLLELNKYQNNKNISNFKKVDLAEIVKNVVGKNKKVKLSLEKAVIKADRDSVSEMISILIDNALKYSNNKLVEIKVKKKGILIVEDKGIGISSEDLPHIFDRFYRSDKARSKDGYGLGLSIAKQIANNHKAKINVDSKIGVGTTFKVFFS